MSGSGYRRFVSTIRPDSSRTSSTVGKCRYLTSSAGALYPAISCGLVDGNRGFTGTQIAEAPSGPPKHGSLAWGDDRPQDWRITRGDGVVWVGKDTRPSQLRVQTLVVDSDVPVVVAEGPTARLVWVCPDERRDAWFGELRAVHSPHVESPLRRAALSFSRVVEFSGDEGHLVVFWNED